MTIISATKARGNIYRLIDDVNTASEPITITNSKGKNAILIAEDDWKAIQETLYLQAIPGMMESLFQGASELLEDCTEYKEDEEW